MLISDHLPSAEPLVAVPSSDHKEGSVEGSSRHPRSRRTHVPHLQRGDDLLSSKDNQATHLLPPASPWVEPLHRLELVVVSVEAAHHIDLPSKGHSSSIPPALLLNKDIGQ